MWQEVSNLLQLFFVCVEMVYLLKVGFFFISIWHGILGGAIKPNFLLDVRHLAPSSQIENQSNQTIQKWTKSVQNLKICFIASPCWAHKALAHLVQQTNHVLNECEHIVHIQTRVFIYCSREIMELFGFVLFGLLLLLLFLFFSYSVVSFFFCFAHNLFVNVLFARTRNT